MDVMKRLWLLRGNIKIEPESLVIETQNNGVKTNVKASKQRKNNTRKSITGSDGRSNLNCKRG